VNHPYDLQVSRINPYASLRARFTGGGFAQFLVAIHMPRDDTIEPIGKTCVAPACEEHVVIVDDDRSREAMPLVGVDANMLFHASSITHATSHDARQLPYPLC